MNIFESLENLNVSEECFNDIINIVEEIINEVSVKDDTLKKIFDRKSQKIASNMSNRNYHVDLARNAETNKGQWHDNHPGKDTQDRYDYQTKHMDQARKLENQGYNLMRGAKRIGNWAYKHKSAGVNKDTVQSYNKLGSTVSKSYRNNIENPT